MTADPQAVLIHWALPLLARARRLADELADGQIKARQLRPSAETLANDIADLIGHPVGDVPPADELAEILATEPPTDPGTRWGRNARLGTREHYEYICAPRAKTVHVPSCDHGMVHSFHPDPVMRVRQGFDLAGHPPHCPAHTRPTGEDVKAAIVARESREPAPPVDDIDRADAEREPAPPECTGCGARPGQGHLLQCAVWSL